MLGPAYPWKEKNLDYEIETKSISTHCLFVRVNELEKKRTSITRLKRYGSSGTAVRRLEKSWKEKNLDYEIETRNWWKMLTISELRLEKKRTSITRLKLSGCCAGNERQIWLGLEKKRTSITRLKRWKSAVGRRRSGLLEKKRTSITRLKRRRSNYGAIKKKKDSWKEKNLDYEIETFALPPIGLIMAGALKRKEPRLRDWNISYPIIVMSYSIILKRKEPRLRDWNAWWASYRRADNSRPWKEKNLDYEIETHFRDVGVPLPSVRLKRKEPRLRDWNWHTWWCLALEQACLKRKEPRLRDWNAPYLCDILPAGNRLEKKRTSITRLKRFNRPFHKVNRTPLEKKRTSITRLKQIVYHFRAIGAWRLEKKRTSITRLKPWGR